MTIVFEVAAPQLPDRLHFGEDLEGQLALEVDVFGIDFPAALFVGVVPAEHPWPFCFSTTVRSATQELFDDFTLPK